MASFEFDVPVRFDTDSMKRSEIVKEAEGWIGTKWQHQQATKQVACDCAGLARGVYANLTGTQVEIMDYPATWHLFKKEERLYETCKEIMDEIRLSDIKAGDILLFAFRPSFVCHHLGIYTGKGTFIHSDMLYIGYWTSTGTMAAEDIRNSIIITKN